MDEIKQDQQVATISKEIESLQGKVANLIIRDEPSSKYGSDLKEFIKNAIKKLEDRRKFFVQPLNDHAKNINNEFKVLTLPLEDMLEILKTKLEEYIFAQRERDKKEAEEKQKKLDEMAEANGLPKVEVKIEEKRTITSSLGKTFTRKDWRWKVVDLNKIPREYFILDEKRINLEVKAHIKNIQGVSSNDLQIEGIEIYQEETVV